MLTTKSSLTIYVYRDNVVYNFKNFIRVRIQTVKKGCCKLREVLLLFDGRDYCLIIVVFHIFVSATNSI